MVDGAQAEPSVLRGEVQVAGLQARVAAVHRGLVSQQIAVDAVAAIALAEVAGDARRHPFVERGAGRERNAAMAIAVRHLPVHHAGRDPLEILSAAGLHVDHRELGIAAVTGGARTPDDLDALDLVHRKLVAELQRGVERLVHLLTVEEQEDLSLVSPDAAEPHVDGALHVHRGCEAGNELEHVEQVARAGREDLFAREQGEDAGAVAQRGRPHGSHRRFLLEPGVRFEELQLGLSTRSRAAEEQRRDAERRKPVAVHGRPPHFRLVSGESGRRQPATIWRQGLVGAGGQLRYTVAYV